MDSNPLYLRQAGVRSQRDLDVYINSIPRELQLIIVEYLDLSGLIKYLEIFGDLSNDEYITLIRSKFNEVYRLNPRNLYKLNGKSVYNSLLYIGNFQDIKTLYKAAKLDPKSNKDLIRYLINNHLKDDISKTKAAIMIDDLELFKKYHKVSVGERDLDRRSGDQRDYFYAILIDNALEILRYQLENGIPENTGSLIIEAYQDNDSIDIEITKELFDAEITNEIMDEHDALEILYFYLQKSMDSYTFILDKLDENFNIEGYDFYRILSHDIVPLFENFYPLWKRYNHLLDEDQLVDVYVGFISTIGSDIEMLRYGTGPLQIITVIANHPIIKKLYLE